ncbi:hypothetical protein CYLTODRAFT_380285 [Cylindrobasidium torrendii FP15055 ss-10]|uniref:Mitochondrial carrier n=1 Tax=Cylindrobasidium torrendii FP15055 ss-10 TaxID=1314674 RepID=A0A0D7B3X4_9AGAR|nr:hypothetical protein CYLTODRAFT_380285 [Cylindrobasidium torrendii FP15055 ss-10]
MVRDDASGDQRDIPNASSLGNLQAALARTATRSIALYFSRPVRLFRPSKVSGWHILRGIATKDGHTLNPQFISGLVKNQGFMVIPKHFIPPMAVNAVLGSVLWTTYGETTALLEPHIGHHPTVTAAISGAVAGGAQAIVAAPAENVRILFEGGTVYHSWSHAWKEVFRGTQEAPMASKQQTREEMRQVRSWMKDVGEMAGRGWDGWGWGCAKDVCGFAVFFSIFEVTRRCALYTKEVTGTVFTPGTADTTILEKPSWTRHLPRTVHGITLVTGGAIAGLAYEFVGRPWDAARRAVEIHRLEASHPARSPWPILVNKFRDEGVRGYFRNPAPNEHPDGMTSASRRRIYTILRTIGRVGPWGIGFLVWEMYSL